MPGLKKLVNATMHVPMRSAFASLQKTEKYGSKGSSRTKCRRSGYLRNELMSKLNELLNSVLLGGLVEVFHQVQV